MDKLLLPIFYSMNFDGTLQLENGVTGNPVKRDRLQSLEQSVNVLLPSEKGQYIVMKNYDGKAGAIMLNSSAKNKRGEYHTGDLVEFI